VPATTAMVGSKTDANGCVKGTGFTWCATKNKCLRRWEEACEDAAATPVCASDEVLCTTALQAKGMNCAVGKCVKVPATTAMVGSKTDANGCVKGTGFTWCAAKNKCLRKWEEACETTDVPVCATGEVTCTAELQSQGMNCVVGACVTAPVRPDTPAVGGKKDPNGCVSGGGYQWCESKKKCLRQWEEACAELTPTKPESVESEEGETPKRTFPGFILNLVANLPADKKAEIQQAMAGYKDQRAQFKGSMKQKMADFKNTEMYKQIPSNFREQMKDVGSVIGKAMADRESKFAALKQRFSAAIAEKMPVVADGVA